MIPAGQVVDVKTVEGWESRFAVSVVEGKEVEGEGLGNSCKSCFEEKEREIRPVGEGKVELS